MTTVSPGIPIIPVIDTFCFNGERVVPMRLEYLNDWVDAFVIVESRWTHSGIRKPHLFKDIYVDWFLPFAHKIHWVIIDEFPEMTAEWQATYREQSWMLNHQEHWFREAYQRDIAADYILHTLRPPADCLIHVSDADEIPSTTLFHPQFKPSFLNCEKPVYLEQEFFYYNFHWKKPYHWHRAFIVKKALLSSATFTQWRICLEPPSYVIPKAGWHFSYFMTPEELQKKLAAFAHRECDQEKWNSVEHIRECISRGVDLFGRINENLVYYEPQNDPGFPPMFLAYAEELLHRQS